MQRAREAVPELRGVQALRAAARARQAALRRQRARLRHQRALQRTVALRTDHMLGIPDYLGFIIVVISARYHPRLGISLLHFEPALSVQCISCTGVSESFTISSTDCALGRPRFLRPDFGHRSIVDSLRRPSPRLFWLGRVKRAPTLT